MIIDAAGWEHEPTPWTNQAACQGSDPDLWFPERGASTREALTTCRACPVRAECLAYALRWKIDWGVWGGTTVHQRTIIRSQGRGLTRPRKLPAAHGTTTRYARGCRCPDCREANTVDKTTRRSR